MDRRQPRPDDTSTGVAARVPRAARLDAWTHADWSKGWALADLPPLQVLDVRTRNSWYEIVVLSGATGEVIVRGGRFFPERRTAHLAGASMGGSFLKLRSIHIGFCLELHAGGQVIVTSPVQHLQVRDAQPMPLQ
jgi:hypothetical protein